MLYRRCNSYEELCSTAHDNLLTFCCSCNGPLCRSSVPARPRKFLIHQVITSPRSTRTCLAPDRLRQPRPHTEFSSSVLLSNIENVSSSPLPILSFPSYFNFTCVIVLFITNKNVLLAHHFSTTPIALRLGITRCSPDSGSQRYIVKICL